MSCFGSSKMMHTENLAFAAGSWKKKRLNWCLQHLASIRDGMKEWSCCKQRSHDFSLFLAIPGAYYFRKIDLTNWVCKVAEDLASWQGDSRPRLVGENIGELAYWVSSLETRPFAYCLVGASTVFVNCLVCYRS
ncbi:Cysteine and histidine-rich domain-containing protein RAR1 [Platanthera guangdongensis]|uniref:Cysteine and histidine-rich domain-containing protein RAR1 n=1 Tax=Platanthera guangdongensis TaxID=2320717 RepID=A0ABR2MK60_9ASPA